MSLTLKLLDYQTLNLNIRLRRVKPDGVALLLATLPNSKLEFNQFKPYLKLEQALEYDETEVESKYDFWGQVAANVNAFLDFLGEAEQTEDISELWFVAGDGADGLASAYALGTRLINGMSIEASLAEVVANNNRASFDYSVICVLDEILGKQSKLLQLVEEYEATDLVVSPEGVTYYRENI